MKILRINHLGIAPKDINLAQNFFGNILNLVSEGAEVVEEQKVHVHFLGIGESRVELLEATDAESPIAKFLQSRGAGIQHVAFEVDNLREWLDHLKKQNVRLIDEEPRKGAHNTLIAFVHPSATGGVLVELVQEQLT